MIELLRSYCLGTIDEAHRERVEEELFADPAVLEEIDEAADDLIRDYLARRLSAEERGQFEAYFLASSQRRQRVAFVRDLLAAVENAAREPGESASASARQG